MELCQDRGEVADLSFQDPENDLLGLVKLLESIILRKKSDLICINPRFTSACIDPHID
jgi:hypothetical protein